MKRARGRASRGSAGVALCCTVLTACSADFEAEPAADGSVEIFSWWSSASERGALRALLQVHRERRPETRVFNAVEELARDARDRLADRMRQGIPPGTFQANIGRDLSQWVLFDGRDDDEAKVAPLNQLAERHDWLGAFHETLIDEVSFDDKLYAVPINVHRINTLYYNVEVLEEERLEVPATLAEFRQVLGTLVERGWEAPLSIGNLNNWTMSQFAMENVLPAVAGPDFYTRYWNGELEPESPEIHETLRELFALWPYFNVDAMTIDWTEGVERLFAQDKSRQAVFTVMGDWAKGHLLTAGFAPGEDFGSAPFPGSQGTFVFTSDCFPLPKGAPNAAEATQLLVTIASRAGQVAFNEQKGSIPARSDVDMDELDELSRVAWQDFRRDRHVLALSGLIDADFGVALGVAIREALLYGDPDPVLFALRNNL